MVEGTMLSYYCIDCYIAILLYHYYFCVTILLYSYLFLLFNSILFYYIYVYFISFNLFYSILFLFYFMLCYVNQSVKSVFHPRSSSRFTPCRPGSISRVAPSGWFLWAHRASSLHTPPLGLRVVRKGWFRPDAQIRSRGTQHTDRPTGAHQGRDAQSWSDFEGKKAMRTRSQLPDLASTRECDVGPWRKRRPLPSPDLAQAIEQHDYNAPENQPPSASTSPSAKRKKVNKTVKLVWDCEDKICADGKEHGAYFAEVQRIDGR